MTASFFQWLFNFRSTKFLQKRGRSFALSSRLHHDARGGRQPRHPSWRRNFGNCSLFPVSQLLQLWSLSRKKSDTATPLPIMAHPPDTTSDLSLEDFLSSISKVVDIGILCFHTYYLLHLRNRGALAGCATEGAPQGNKAGLQGH